MTARPLLSLLIATSALLAPIAPAMAGGDLHELAAAGDEVAVLQALEAGAGLETRDAHGRTPLIAAAQHGRKKLVLALLERGADTEATDANGYTALIWAAQQGHTPVIAALLTRGARIDAREKHDYTALEWAAWEGHAKAVRLLLHYGADAGRRTRWGFTAADLARRHQNAELMRIFEPAPAAPPTPIVVEAPPEPKAASAAPAGWREIGRSRKGAPIHLASLGSGERSVLFIGSIHGDEAQGTDVIHRLLREVPRLPALLARNRVLAIPNANPDGVSRRMRTNLGGVDLNRNFPTHWRPSARGRYFSGPRPLSEPESQALQRAIEGERPALIVSFHAHMACNNYDGQAAEPIARAMARLNGYRLMPQIGYETPGSLGQHAAFGMGIPIVTLEVGFEAPEQLWRKVRDSLMVALEPGRL